MTDWRHTHTHIYTKPKEKKVVTSLCASSPSPATATPSPSGVVGELLERASRRHVLTVRHHGWGWGTNGVSGAISARTEGGNRRYSGSGEGNGGRSVPPAGSRDRTDSGEPSDRNPRTGTLEQEPSNRSFLSHHTVLLRNSPRPPFCSAGLRPVAPPRSLLHLSSRRFEKGLDRGRSSSLTASHRASTNRERAAPPLPLLTKRDDYPAGDSGGRNSGGRFRREIQAGEIRAGDVLPGPRRSLCCSYPASFTRPAEIVAAR